MGGACVVGWWAARGGATTAAADSPTSTTRGSADATKAYRHFSASSVTIQA